eukprot:3811536-Rhodomonas_salina.1
MAGLVRSAAQYRDKKDAVIHAFEEVGIDCALVRSAGRAARRSERVSGGRAHQPRDPGGEASSDPSVDVGVGRGEVDEESASQEAAEEGSQTRTGQAS